MPFGKYSSFDDCVSKNQDKENPEGFCAYLEKKITGKYPSEKSMLDNIQIKTNSPDVVGWYNGKRRKDNGNVRFD